MSGRTWLAGLVAAGNLVAGAAACSADSGGAAPDGPLCCACTCSRPDGEGSLLECGDPWIESNRPLDCEAECEAVCTDPAGACGWTELVAVAACGDAAGSVTGTQLHTYVHEGGRTDVPVDLSAVPVHALVPDGNGGWDVVEGTGTPDGTFEVRGVRDGRYLLCLPTLCVDTDRRELDLGWVSGGRPGAALATSPGTILRLALDGLAPFGAGGFLQLVAPNADVSVYYLEQLAALAPGSTSLAADLAWIDVAYPEPRLIDAGEGDVTTVGQLVPAGAGAATYARIERALVRSDVVMRDGETVLVSGSLAAVPLDRELPLDWRRSEFAALAAAVSPGAVRATHGLALSALLSAGSDGFYASSADLVTIGPDEGAPADLALTLSYGDPYPASWTRFVDARMEWEVEYALGDGAPLVWSGRVVVLVEAPAAGRAPIRPALSPVSSLAVEGGGGPGSRWVVRWEPPSIGTPDSYSVRVRRLFEDGGRTRSELAAQIFTLATSVELPPTLLDPGARYFVQVTALAGVDPEAPSRERLPFAAADALSPILER